MAQAAASSLSNNLTDMTSAKFAIEIERKCSACDGSGKRENFNIHDLDGLGPINTNEAKTLRDCDECNKTGIIVTVANVDIKVSPKKSK